MCFQTTIDKTEVEDIDMVLDIVREISTQNMFVNTNEDVLSEDCTEELKETKLDFWVDIFD